jgi:hypothetical protein
MMAIHQPAQVVKWAEQVGKKLVEVLVKVVAASGADPQSLARDVCAGHELYEPLKRTLDG